MRLIRKRSNEDSDEHPLVKRKRSIDNEGLFTIIMNIIIIILNILDDYSDISTVQSEEADINIVNDNIQAEQGTCMFLISTLYSTMILIII